LSLALDASFYSNVVALCLLRSAALFHFRSELLTEPMQDATSDTLRVFEISFSERGEHSAVDDIEAVFVDVLLEVSSSLAKESDFSHVLFL
jgi:hypothetical protein